MNTTTKRSHKRRGGPAIPEPEMVPEMAAEVATSIPAPLFKIGDKVLITREMRIPGQTVRVGYPAVVSGTAAGGKVKVSGDGPCRGRNFWLNTADLVGRV